MASKQEQLVMEQELATLITRRTICFKCDISEDTLSRLMKTDPTFPRPVSLLFGPRNAAQRFVLSEVLAYFRRRLGERKQA